MNHFQNRGCYAFGLIAFLLVVGLTFTAVAQNQSYEIALVCTRPLAVSEIDWHLDRKVKPYQDLSFDADFYRSWGFSDASNSDELYRHFCTYATSKHITAPWLHIDWCKGHLAAHVNDYAIDSDTYRYLQIPGYARFHFSTTAFQEGHRT